MTDFDSPTLTCCVRFGINNETQVNTVPPISNVFCSRRTRNKVSTKSNAVLKSRRPSIVTDPVSAANRKSETRQSRAVSLSDAVGMLTAILASGHWIEDNPTSDLPPYAHCLTTFDMNVKFETGL